jgi:hypothetical protein
VRARRARGAQALHRRGAARLPLARRAARRARSAAPLALAKLLAGLARRVLAVAARARAAGRRRLPGGRSPTAL